MQSAGHLLMIRPIRFTFNDQTSVNNNFQKFAVTPEVQSLALKEFEHLLSLLQAHDVDVMVVDDTHQPHTPDALFPNNWISFHEEGTIILYPMFAPNRRRERNPHILSMVLRKFDFAAIYDLSYHEQEGKFLEGTGSLVLDRTHQIAYACYSERTNEELFVQDFAARMHYHPIGFRAFDEQGYPIYHTNVMMSVADKFAVICLDTISDTTERNLVHKTLVQTDKHIIPISLRQMHQFAGNVLQVHSRQGQRYTVMSTQAFDSLSSQQIADIEQFNPILHAPLTTIETYGGGSARCMLAEIFLPLK